MSNRGRLEARIHSGVSAIDAVAWDRLFPGDPECHAYYRACEAAPPPAFRLGAVSVERQGLVVAAAPFFRLDYRLDTPLQGRWRPLGEWLHKRLPRLVKVPLLCLGSPLADRCHIGVAPGLDQAEAGAALRALLGAIRAEAERNGVSLIAVKDLSAEDAGLADTALAAAGFARTASLPVAVLDLPFKDEQAYLASLSAATRKDIRRKLRSAAAVRIEQRQDIRDIEDRIVALYDETRGQSGVDYGDFERLTPAYFSGVVQALGPKATVMLYWLGEELIGFNLLLVGTDRVIDKFIGMRYPLAREMNLYAVSWLANVRFCIERGIARLQTGQTAYASKVRFGSRLEPSSVYFRHRGRVINKLFRTFGPMLAFDKLDPELKALAAARRIPEPAGR